MKYHHVILGGTFDHFHLGHKKLLEYAVKIGKKITVGIAQENLYKNKLLSETIEPFQTRKKSVGNHLSNYLVDDRIIDIISISDIYGTTLADKDIDAIIVSNATCKNADKINRRRQKKGWTKMKIIVVDDVLAEDGKLLTSERIRLGEINREGKSYWLMANSYLGKTRKELILPEKLREELRIPLGKAINNNEKLIMTIKKLKKTMLIAVGDIIVDSLLKQEIEPDIKVIDFRSRRQPISLNSYHSHAAVQESYINKPGTINIKSAFKLKDLILKAIKQPKLHSGSEGGDWLVIDGEEDLLTLPAILFAPLGALVLYGQMDLGVILIEATEEIKGKAGGLLKKFS